MGFNAGGGRVDADEVVADVFVHSVKGKFSGDGIEGKILGGGSRVRKPSHGQTGEEQRCQQQEG